MSKQQKQLDAYDTVFDFIFSSYKSPRQNIVPGRSITFPPMAGIAGGLAEIAMSPAMYPVHYAMGDVNRELNSLAKVRVEPLRGLKVDVGPGNVSQFLGNPRGFIGRVVDGYKVDRNWAGVGGWTKRFDAALFAVWGKSLGLSTGDMINILSGINRLDSSILGQERSHMSSHIAAFDSSTNMIRWLEHKYGLSTNNLENLVGQASDVGNKSHADKHLRIEHMDQGLRAMGMPNADASHYAQEFWGKKADANAMKTRLTASGIAGPQADALVNSFLRNAISVEALETQLAGLGLSASRANRISTTLDKDRDNEDFGVWWHEDVPKDDLEYEGKLRTKSFNDMLYRVQIEIDNSAGNRKRKLEGYKHWLEVYRDKYSKGKGFGPVLGLGMNVGRFMHLRNWTKNASSGAVLRAFLLGDTKAINDLFSFNELIKKPLDADLTSHGVTGFVFQKRQVDSPRGVISEALYYWHPVNIAKGVFWDGRTWAKFAEMTNNRGFQTIAGFTPKQLALRGMGWLKNKLGVGKGIRKAIYGKIQKFFATAFSNFLKKSVADLMKLPIKEIIKQAIIKVLSQVIGNTLLPGAGTLVGIVIDVVLGITLWVTEKMLKPLLEVGALVLLGIVALFLILLFGGDGVSKRFNRHLNTPITAVVSSASGSIFDPATDWASDSEAPASYLGVCITSNALDCRQGPCGARSHGDSGSRAVDLNWSGMGSNPGIQAPADGVILSKSKAISYCGDGTRKGGEVYFKDSNGYTWFFAHARPVASGPVKAGDIIGQVQYEGPEVEIGACWDGAHAHIQIWDPSGKLVDAEEFMNSIGCNFSCPARDRC